MGLNIVISGKHLKDLRVPKIIHYPLSNFSKKKCHTFPLPSFSNMRVCYFYLSHVIVIYISTYMLELSRAVI